MPDMTKKAISFLAVLAITGCGDDGPSASSNPSPPTAVNCPAAGPRGGGNERFGGLLGDWLLSHPDRQKPPTDAEWNVNLPSGAMMVGAHCSARGRIVEISVTYDLPGVTRAAAMEDAATLLPPGSKPSIQATPGLCEIDQFTNPVLGSSDDPTGIADVNLSSNGTEYDPTAITSLTIDTQAAARC